jgi:signal transduction histidine kinase
VGVVAILVVYPVYAVCDPNVRSGRSSDMWAAAFFGAGMVACWLVGTLLRQQRERRVMADRASQLETEAAHAVAEERARLARDLHDIVSHNLSVMVVQAAGARARGSSDASTLEKIERSGRASLVEMRRLLGVLRAEDEQATLVPQPGVGDLEELVQHVRDSGIPVELSVTGIDAALPAAIELSVFRIVQEALTNIVKHAGPARAAVTVAATQDSVRIEVCDDGRAAPAQDGSGHGLIGMRERAALLHGEVSAGPLPSGGFRVCATLPLAAGA